VKCGEKVYGVAISFIDNNSDNLDRIILGSIEE